MALLPDARASGAEAPPPALPTWRDLKALPHVGLAGLVFTAFLVFVLPEKARQGALLHPGVDTPDLLFHYGRDELYAIFEALGPSGRATYVYDRWTFDVVWPLAYTYVYLACLGNLCRVLDIRGRAWLWIALAPLLLDLVENTCGTLVVLAYPELRDALATLAGFATTAKWSAVVFAMVMIAVGLLVYAARRLRSAP